ncbi:MAG: putative addiction module antidote protein [Alphaproteobacteria bacterium 41-28]|nr:MAG: putative addiction module antidote protein [Alphaproteobacteria bacterium 41-28]
MEKLIEYKDYLSQSLKDPEEAAEYLNAALEEGDLSLFTLALKDVVDALGGGVGATAKKNHLNRESLYRMLSKNGNPRLTSLTSVMSSLGLEVHIVSKKRSPLRHISA